MDIVAGIHLNTFSITLIYLGTNRPATTEATIVHFNLMGFK